MRKVAGRTEGMARAVAQGRPSDSLLPVLSCPPSRPPVLPEGSLLGRANTCSWTYLSISLPYREVRPERRGGDP